MRAWVLLLLALAAPLAAAGPWASGPSFSCTTSPTYVCGSAGRCARSVQVSCRISGQLRAYDVYFLWWKVGEVAEYAVEERYASVSAYNPNDPPAKLIVETSRGPFVYDDSYALFCADAPFPVPFKPCFGYPIDGRTRVVTGGWASTVALTKKWGVLLKAGGNTFLCNVFRCAPKAVSTWAGFSVLVIPRSAEVGEAGPASPWAVAASLGDGVVVVGIVNPLNATLELRGVEVGGAQLAERPPRVFVQPNSTEALVLRLTGGASSATLTLTLTDGAQTYTIPLTVELQPAEGERWPAAATVVVAVVAAAFAALAALAALKVLRHAVEEERARRCRFVKRR